MKAGSASPATLLRRLGAMLYDTLLVLAIWLMTLFVLVAVTNNAATGAAVQSLLFFELVGFFLFFWYFKGQTLGMLAWNLTLVSCTGHALSPLQLFIRFVGAMLSFVTLGFGYLWILFDTQNRSWSDMLSDTQILHTP